MLSHLLPLIEKGLRRTAWTQVALLGLGGLAWWVGVRIWGGM